MNVAGEHTFDAPQEMVWAALQDPLVLGAILPGGEGIAAVGENEFKGNLKVKVGPVQGTFSGHIQLSNVVAPESYDISVDGKGAPGFVKANGGLKLTAQGEQTHMVYQGTAQVGGRLASVGQRLIESSAKAIIHQSLLALNEYLKVQMAQKYAAEHPPLSRPRPRPKFPSRRPSSPATPPLPKPKWRSTSPKMWPMTSSPPNIAPPCWSP
ncbi:MAG: carbon monoxide dehydrogenase subunit G [Chloroflexi bacterium]|nr:carbon monoxide dehydrogenase subunit G [Chloroflexota bacterium]